MGTPLLDQERWNKIGSTIKGWQRLLYTHQDSNIFI